MKKQNNCNKLTRIALALLLILSMLGNTLILSVVAQESAMPADEPTLSETPTPDEADAASTPTLPDPIRLTAADIPEFISAAALTERGAVERMRSEETNMSSVIFRNADGTRTMYMYGLPVKYTAMDGTVRDKSTNLVSVPIASVLLSNQPVAQTVAQMSTTQRAALQEELGVLDAERAANTLHILSTALTARQRSLSDMAYTTLDNDVYALFPTNLAQGMTLVFGEHSVRMTPAGTGLTVTAGGNVTKTTTTSLSDSDVAERLLYPNVFGLGTAVQYTPTLTGVKERILLSRNVGKNSFAFLLETGGLVLTEPNGQFILIDPETEQQVGKLGEIIVFDSAGQITRGNMTAQTILAGQKYRITISVDQEFLASATYPVSIDPTISCTVQQFEVAYSEIKYIEDVGIYSAPDAWNFSFEQMHFIGKSTHGNYYGAVLYRFPFLYDLDFFDSNQVFLTSLTLRCWMGNTSSITVHTKEFTENWDDSVRICDEELYSSATGGSADQYFKTYTISNDGGVTLDITEITKAWIDYIVNPNAVGAVNPEFGLSLYSTDTTKQIQINAVDYIAYNDTLATQVTIEYMPSTSYSPYYYINNKYNSSFLSDAYTNQYVVNFVNGTISELGENAKWSIRPYAANQYTISTFLSDGHLLLNQSGGLTVTEDVSPSCLWSLEYYGEEDVVLRNVAEDSVALCVDSQGFLVTAALSNQESIGESGNLPGSAFLWRIVHGDEYNEFQMPNEDVNVFANGNSSILELINARSFDLSSLHDFEFISLDVSIMDISSDTVTVYQTDELATVAVTHKPTGQLAYIGFATCAALNGTYLIKNKQTSMYLRCFGSSPSDGGYVRQTSFDGSLLQKWEINLLDDGYYTIRIIDESNAGYYMGVMEDSNSSGAYITTRFSSNTDSLTDGAKWKISLTASGAYKFVPKVTQNLGFSLSLRSLNSPTTNQLPYIQDDDYKDEWYIFRLNHNITVNHYYDNGQTTRYDDALSKISEVQLALKMYFAQIFGVDITSTTPQYYPTLADLCKVAVTMSNIDDICEKWEHRYTTEEINGQIYYCYCTDRESYIDEFNADGNSTTTNILWSGHAIRSRSPSTDDEIGIITYTSRSCSLDRAIFMLKEYDDIKTLVHEMAHQYGAKDHYCELVNGTCKFSDRCNNPVHNHDESKRRDGWCVMDNDGLNGVSYWSDIGERNIDEIFCADCINDILTYLKSCQ